MYIIDNYSHEDKTRRILDLDKILLTHSFDCWADTDSSCDWQSETAHCDPTTSESHTGWVITYMGFPISWASKMQTQMLHQL